MGDVANNSQGSIGTENVNLSKDDSKGIERCYDADPAVGPMVAHNDDGYVTAKQKSQSNDINRDSVG